MAIYTDRQVVDERIQTVMSQAATRLTQAGLSTETYVIPNSSAYAAITEVPEAPVYCLEARLGPTHNRPGYSSYGVAQIFHPRYPSMALILMISRRDSDGTLDDELPVYNPGIDKAFSSVFLPFMHSAFNSLDPTGRQKGILVQDYSAHMTLPDLPQATLLSINIIRRFKKDGQLASIAVDFEDALQTLIARMLIPFKAIADLHHIPKTASASRIEIPLRSSSETPFIIENNSTALDQGIAIACGYLEKHYQEARDIRQAEENRYG